MIPRDAQTVRAEHEALVKDIMRENAYQKIIQEIRRSQPRWYARRANWLLCELDYRRVVLAERLAHYELVRSILRGEQAHLFSAGRCV